MEIETRRLHLRPLREDDAFAMAHAVNNLNVSRHLARVPHPYDHSQAMAFIAAQRGFDPRSRVLAIAFRAAPDELIGLIAYEADDKGHFEFGYWLNESCWGLGLMKEAARAMLTHALRVDGVEELHAAFHDDNPASGHILQDLGFEVTGHEAQFSLAQGRCVPTTKLRLTQKESRAA